METVQMYDRDGVHLTDLSHNNDYRPEAEKSNSAQSATKSNSDLPMGIVAANGNDEGNDAKTEMQTIPICNIAEPCEFFWRIKVLSDRDGATTFAPCPLVGCEIQRVWIDTKSWS